MHPCILLLHAPVHYLPGEDFPHLRTQIKYHKVAYPQSLMTPFRPPQQHYGRLVPPLARFPTMTSSVPRPYVSYSLFESVLVAGNKNTVVQMSSLSWCRFLGCHLGQERLQHGAQRGYEIRFLAWDPSSRL